MKQLKFTSLMHGGSKVGLLKVWINVGWVSRLEANINQGMHPSIMCIDHQKFIGKKSPYTQPKWVSHTQAMPSLK
jgi:hypothetical protein